MPSGNHTFAPQECFDIENLGDGTITSVLNSQDSNVEPLQRSRVGNQLW